MKRAFLRKVKPVSCSLCVTHADVNHAGASHVQAGDSEEAPSGVKRRARTSAAMVGLALSMGATSLLVPRQGDSAQAAESKIPEATPSSVSQMAAAPALDTGLTVSPAAGETIEHIVRQGQTLRQVAERYRVDIESLAAANGLTTHASLKAGQVLKIPVSSAGVTEPDASRSPQLTALADLNRLPSPTDSSVSGADSRANQVRAERDRALGRLQQERNKLKTSLAELRREESGTLVAGVEGVVAEPAKGPDQPQQNQRPVITEMPGDSEPSPSPIAILPSPVASPSVLDNQVAPAPSPDLDWMRVSRSLILAPEAATATVPSVQPSEQPEASSQVNPAQPSRASARPTATLPAVPPVQIAASTPSLEQQVSYRVNPGDTVAQIARAHNITQATLISANRLSNPNVIFVGQVLRLPESQQEASSRSVDRPTVPSVLPASTVSVSASEQAEKLPSVVPSVSQADSTEARTLAVVPSTIAPSGLPSLTSPVDALPDTSEAATGRNPYVQSLLSEVKAMREKLTQPPATVAAVTTPAADTAEAAASLQDVSAVEVPVRVDSRAASLEPGTTRRPQALRVAPRQTTPTVVAAAPMGSENYAPLLEPITGRMVSPDLPSLPNADRFLPDGIFKGYIWPARGVLTSGYGWRWGRMHRGIDIASDIGTPIYAAATGVVEYAGWNSGGYGNMIEIRHADGSMTRYAHLNAIYVQQGQRLGQGEQIGEMGSTGYSTGPHLHFEVHLPDQGTVNPMAYLPAE
ncbi:peptidoglycan DD-metalloendopeptidase family protein [Leptolyngbya sp. NK1-12]|uniref:Peptidoglycan DD-metalloendopeptidase family protein n=1 Tax=Leptolyngbya sp. NK1-12 TaxID=2547451 RepID=A0AA97AIT0_9CYAN|nr:peptidoglycan DD-metalloendopeptidase family protein [Leptolyngbya sp. NK1-12]